MPLSLLLLGFAIFTSSRANPNPNRGEFRQRVSSRTPTSSDLGTDYIDLTHAFNNETVVWPTVKISFFTEFEGRTKDGIWKASNGFCASEHTSTHIDAPYHFNEHARRLNEIPFEDLIDIQGVMIDIYDKVHKFENGVLNVIENYALTREDILEWEQIHGKIPQGSVVLLRSGWESRWGNLRLFRGEKESGNNEDGDDSKVSGVANMNFPAFDATAAKFLAVEREVLGVGVDVLSVDPGNLSKFRLKLRTLCTPLHQVPPRGFNLWIVPFKIDRGTGAPTRVIARINRV